MGKNRGRARRVLSSLRQEGGTPGTQDGPREPVAGHEAVREDCCSAPAARILPRAIHVERVERALSRQRCITDSGAKSVARTLQNFASIGEFTLHGGCWEPQPEN